MVRGHQEDYEVVESTTKYRGRVLNLRLDKVRFPNQRIFSREVVEHGGAVAIVPLCEDESVIFVEQYRHPVKGTLLEIPAGLPKAGENPEHCALRELREETGWIAHTLHKLTEFYPTPGYSSEIIHLFLAMVDRESSPEPEADEVIEVRRLGLDDALNLVLEAKISDAKTVIGLLLTSKYLKK